MGNISVVSVCDLSMIKAEYRQIEANGRSPFYGYRITVTLNGETKAQFNVHQEMADDFANESRLSFELTPDTGSQTNSAKNQEPTIRSSRIRNP
jgi:hypothetical protein